jgi:hypothetical protein
MKKQNVITKKIFPPSARRITRSDGVRVWVVFGVEYSSKRVYLQHLQDLHDKSKVISNGKTVAETEAKDALLDAQGSKDVQLT